MLSGTISRWLARTLEGLCYRNSETVVALSPGMARGITHRTPNAHVITIPNAADLDLFTPTLHIPKAIADFAKGKFLVVYAGTLGRANGTMELIEIADEVSRRPSPAIHFLILGDGADRTHMQSSANQRNLTNITFLGIRPKTEIAQWYAAADVTLCLFKPLPVLATTSPNKLFDSLAAGRPVLNNTDGWIKDLLERTGAGITVPGSSAAAAADALCRLQRDPDLLRSMGRNARSAAESHFARSDLAAMYATLFTATPPVPPNHASNSSSI
jgi:glycosyltransferase involved in cell wall biosynthesis